MITKFLITLFVKNPDRTTNPKTRSQYALLASGTGIFANILLFLGKLIAGLTVGSMAMVADAVNNIADAASAVIAGVGVRLSGKHADKEHPLGHGRLEYIAALFVDILIIFAGVELFKAAIEKIRNPVIPQVSTLVLILLGVAILAKLWLYLFYNHIHKRIDSATLRGAALDSLSDTAATTVVLVSAIVGKHTGLPLDGWAGLLVAAFVVFTGLKATGETVTLLLGTSPKPELVESIYAFTARYPQVVGIHDLMVHDYGPGRKIITLHAEVPENETMVDIHDIIDTMERDMQKEFSCIATIHMDPISVGDEKVDAMRRIAEECAKEVDPSFTIHDFRVTGGNCNNLIFDLCIPTDTKYHDSEAAALVAERISEKHPECRAVIRPEHPFI